MNNGLHYSTLNNQRFKKMG